MTSHTTKPIHTGDLVLVCPHVQAAPRWRWFEAIGDGSGRPADRREGISAPGRSRLSVASVRHYVVSDPAEAASGGAR